MDKNYEQKSTPKRDLNEILKERELQENSKMNDGTVKLDDTQRVKVLSPSRLVFKRFIRNKLAIVGTVILAFMFLFCFLGAVLYPYSQTQIFYEYDYVTATYGGATQRTSYTNYTVDPSTTVSSLVNRMMNSYIETMEEQGLDDMEITDDTVYNLHRLGDGVYTLEVSSGEEVARYQGTTQVATVNRLNKQFTYSGEELGEDFEAAAVAALNSASFSYDGVTYTLSAVGKTTFNIQRTGNSVSYVSGAGMGAEFEAQVLAAVEQGGGMFEQNGNTYAVSADGNDYSVRQVGQSTLAQVSTIYVFDAFETGTEFSDEFKIQTLLNAYNGESYTADGTSYKVQRSGQELTVVSDGSGVALLTDFVVRDASGKDTFDIAFKEAVSTAIDDMIEKNAITGSMTYSIAQRVTELDEDGNEVMVYLTDDAGERVYEDTVININRQTSQYTLSCNQLRHLIDISAPPSADHPFGTDSDGMDILARMMYGGRVSLLVGFVVVFLETFIGVIMGGIAGYFGGWVDNIIMRLVDIFYCIPSMPILIILGSVMDSMKVTPYVRLVYMMIVLGILGWASVARLVRGQILALRDQEFMVATEATGIKVNRRIFRHLMPNVMPQLIVTATAGLGSVILTESTLSFLGLGVKHPLATWGTMINSVTQSNESMIRYTYIWIPVGLLICLTVIAFNFVGDGLRDAFDPKMKR